MSAAALMVAPSTLPQAGLGLFTLRPLKKNVIVCPYGVVKRAYADVDWWDRDPCDGRCDYALEITPTHFIDGFNNGNIALGARANTILNPLTHRSHLAKVNVIYQRIAKEYYLVTRKAVQAGEELFAYYGPSFAMHH